MAMQIFAKSLKGQTVTVDVEPSTRIYEVKYRVAYRMHIPESMLRLIFAGKYLMDGDSLADYNIQKETTLHVLLRRSPDPTGLLPVYVSMPRDRELPIIVCCNSTGSDTVADFKAQIAEREGIPIARQVSPIWASYGPFSCAVFARCWCSIYPLAY